MLLLPVFIHSAVVDDFKHIDRCQDSLFKGTPPRGYLKKSLKKICQRYEGVPRFVTLYDAQKHIPVYSAYMFRKSDGEKSVDFPWMFEPQVSVFDISVQTLNECLSIFFNLAT